MTQDTTTTSGTAELRATFSEMLVDLPNTEPYTLFKAGFDAALAAGQATAAQPAAQQRAAYAALPTSSHAGRVYEEGFLIGTCPLYTADKLRAFADATHTLRASHGQAPAGATLPDGWVPLTITHEGQYPEDVAYGPQTMMDRLGKWLGKYSAQAAQADSVLEDALRERDEADDFIDTLLDEVLGADRAEWSSAYGRADALEEVRERITALHKPAVERAWKQFEAATQQAGIPGNFITHRAAWREALETAKFFSTGANRSYWDHELAAFDRSFDRLWTLMRGAPQPPSPQADSVQEDAARLLALEAAANQIFNNPPIETSQDVRDVIEWFSGSIRVVLDAARKQGEKQ